MFTRFNLRINFNFSKNKNDSSDWLIFFVPTTKLSKQTYKNQEVHGTTSQKKILINLQLNTLLTSVKILSLFSSLSSSSLHQRPFRFYRTSMTVHVNTRFDFKCL